MLLGKKKFQSYNQINFAKLISKLSKTQVIIVKNNNEIEKYFNKNLRVMR